ncbi:nephrin-like [Coccinella septempunctata]|uniref:nephrin-like n=1 Tax=Coccinella septempunctata TaxID=41139 RepID=UPI001D07566F|nr:nephrin-like [Coccinella septempunctata]
MMISTTTHVLTLFPLMVVLQNVKGNIRTQEPPNQLQEFVKNYRTSRSYSTVEVKVIEKGVAFLPCDLSPPKYADRILIIAWYKEDGDPIFSYDQRTMPPVEWRNTSIQFRHLSFTFKKPATLILSNILEKDEGVYRCRIDYSSSATKNHWIELEVVVPPKKLTIIDEKGRHLSSTAGPYDEGGSMILKCVVIGGKPSSEIVWLKNDRPIESTRFNSGSPESQLSIAQLARSNVHDTYTCRASNNNITLPLRKIIRVDINLGPLFVKIMNDNSFSVGKKHTISCLTHGSKPPAKIIWLIDNQVVDKRRFLVDQIYSTDGNSTTSILSFTPTRDENGLTLTCRALNTLLAYRILEDSIKLNVTYMPQTTIYLGKNLKAEYIQEGHDVYFECEVDANPASNKLMWFHNGKLLKDNKKNDISLNHNALVLRNITKHQNGNYSCVATNDEGIGKSNNFHLRIMYKPICKANQPRVYGVARHELAKILCEVESHPPPNTFKWSFNNSAENIDILPSRKLSSINRFISIVTYKPIYELDYGTILCWASNAAGKQSEPCVFHIVPAGKPDRPYNCTILNTSSYSLEIKCVEGFDGGLPQTAQVSVYDQITSVLISSVSASFPMFLVDNLEPGKLLKIEVYAVNSKGRSEPVVLSGYTLLDAEKRSVLSMDVQSRLEIVPVLGAIVGFVIMVVIVSIAAFIIVRLKMCKLRRNSPVFSVDNSKSNLSVQKRPNGRDFLEKDENNPDIIPVYTNLQQLSSNNSNQHSPQDNIFTPLTEAFLAKNREQELYSLNYAELAPLQTGGSKNKKFTPSRMKDKVIYAEIEHDGKDEIPSKFATGLVVDSENSSLPLGKTRNYAESKREVVTTKGPFLGYHQESCV